MKAVLACRTNYLIDTEETVIVDVKAPRASPRGRRISG
jgi:hypothetical protein